MSPDKTIDATADGDWMHDLPGYADEAALHEQLAEQLKRGGDPMRIEITLDTSNAAFEDRTEDEVCRILTKLALQIKGYLKPLANGLEYVLRDVNGNVVGHMAVEQSTPDEVR